MIYMIIGLESASGNQQNSKVFTSFLAQDRVSTRKIELIRKRISKVLGQYAYGRLDLPSQESRKQQYNVEFRVSLENIVCVR